MTKLIVVLRNFANALQKLSFFWKPRGALKHAASKMTILRHLEAGSSLLPYKTEIFP